jgi:arginine deiminase
MQTSISLNINSEINPLKSVLLHRPGQELENLTPSTLHELLFDDIPFLEVAQEEHDFFANKLRELGTTVYYLEDLMSDILADVDIRQTFIDEFLAIASVRQQTLKTAIVDYLSSLSPRELTNKLIAGITKDELNYKDTSFSAHINRDRLFATAPLPNLYFMRDPATVFGATANFNHMFSDARRCESLFCQYIFTYHSRFKTYNSYNWIEGQHSIEGGDVLVLNKHTLAIGISERTRAQAVEKLAASIFFGEQEQNIKKIIAFHIPSTRAFMHLDTILTQVDVDKFAVHPGIVEQTQVYQLTPGNNKKLQYHQLSGSIDDILSRILECNVTTFKCGGGDVLSSRREQWSDGVNTLAVRPGEVLVYRRNKITNQVLQDNGIIVHAIPCSELSRGRGGPRCMSMPLERG